MCIVTKPGRPLTKDLHGEQETTEQIGIVGGRGKTLLPNIVSLLKSKDAAAAAIDGDDMPTEQVVRNESSNSLLARVGETTKTTKESADIVEFKCPQARAASESAAAEENTGELVIRPGENAALPAVVSMSTMAASNNGLATGSIINIISSTHTASASSFLAESASESGAILGQQMKKKSSGKKKKKRAMIVDHTYHEHMNDLPPGDTNYSKKSGASSGVTTRSSVANRQGSNVEQRQFRRRARGGVQHPFPAKLHQVLEEMEKNGHENIMGWMPHGRSFMVKDPKEFVKEYMPTYFNQHKLASFQRQLNLYGFKRLTGEGPDRGSYYHELFLRGKPYLGYQIKRVRIKGTGVRAASNPEGEPNFYRMPYCYGDGGVSIDNRQHTVAEPTPIIPQEETTKTPGSDGDKDLPIQDKMEASSYRSESEPPASERSSLLLSPEISPPPSPTTMSAKPMSNLDEKRIPIKKRKPATKSANMTSPKKRPKKTSSHKNVCINPVTMEIIRSTPYSGRSTNANKDDASSLADFQSTIYPLEANKVAARPTQVDDGIDEVSFCGCHFHYMGHLNRDALNEIEAFHPPESIAIPSSLMSTDPDMNVPYLAPNMISSLTLPTPAAAKQITPSSSTEQVSLCHQCGGARPPVATGNYMARQLWPTLEAPVLSRHVSFEDHEHDGDYIQEHVEEATSREAKKTTADYSEPHRSAKEEMDHFFESFELPYDYLSDREIEEHELMNLDSDKKLAAALEEVVNSPTG